MPSDLMLKTMNGVHRGVMKITGGRVGWNIGGMKVIELTTVGRRSGERRSVMLTSPVQEGDAIVVVASRGGDDHHPGWYLNLVADPEVDVTIKGEHTPMRARVAIAEERVWLWPKVVEVAKNYAGYQRKTEREIPLVLLEPR